MRAFTCKVRIKEILAIVFVNRAFKFKHKELSFLYIVFTSSIYMCRVQLGGELFLDLGEVRWRKKLSEKF